MTIPQSKVDHFRGLSKSLFGQSYKLELMLEIASSSDGIVCLKDLAKELEVSVSSLQTPFHSLIKAGLLSPLPDIDSRFRYYIRNNSLAWAWIEELTINV